MQLLLVSLPILHHLDGLSALLDVGKQTFQGPASGPLSYGVVGY
jgi:hypothetical protein